MLTNSFGKGRHAMNTSRISTDILKLTVHQDSHWVVSVGFHQGDSRKSHGFVLQGMGSCLEWLFPTWSLQTPTKQDIKGR